MRWVRRKVRRSQGVRISDPERQKGNVAYVDLEAEYEKLMDTSSLSDSKVHQKYMDARSRPSMPVNLVRIFTDEKLPLNLKKNSWEAFDE